MSADTFVSALFIITAVVAAGILINAVYPIIWNTAGTFTSSAHDTDTRMRTDFKVINTYAKAGFPYANIWMKNIGSNPIGSSEINQADIFIVSSAGIDHHTYDSTNAYPNPPAVKEWNYKIFESTDTNSWNQGETLEIYLHYPDDFDSMKSYTLQFTLPNGVLRTVEFTPSP
jgi:flagellar protein FlaG